MKTAEFNYRCTGSYLSSYLSQTKARLKVLIMPYNLCSQRYKVQYKSWRHVLYVKLAQFTISGPEKCRLVMLTSIF